MDASLATLYGAAIGAAAALLGSLLAVILEPLKLRFAHSHEKQMLRTAIYKELAVIYLRLTALQNTPTPESVKSIINWLNFLSISFDCYNYAKSKPEVFYGLKEAVEIETVYNLLSSFPTLKAKIENLILIIGEGEKSNPDLAAETSAGVMLVVKELANRATSYLEESAKTGKLERNFLFSFNS